MGARSVVLARTCRLRLGANLSPSERPSLRRVPETLPCPRLAVQNSRLTWASGQAAWSRRVAGRQVRCRLQAEGRRRNVSSDDRSPPSAASSTRDENPRGPCGRPIKTTRSGWARTPSECGGRMEASRNRSLRNVPKFAFSRGFLGGVPPWRASVRRSSSTHGAGVGSRRRTRRRHRTPRHSGCAAERTSYCTDADFPLTPAPLPRVRGRGVPAATAVH